MLIEAHIWIQPCHAHIHARLTLNVIGIGFFESGFVKNVFRQFDDVDVVVIAASHCAKRLNVTAGSIDHFRDMAAASRINGTFQKATAKDDRATGWLSGQFLRHNASTLLTAETVNDLS